MNIKNESEFDSSLKASNRFLFPGGDTFEYYINNQANLSNYLKEIENKALVEILSTDLFEEIEAFKNKYLVKPIELEKNKATTVKLNSFAIITIPFIGDVNLFKLYVDGERSYGHIENNNLVFSISLHYECSGKYVTENVKRIENNIVKVNEEVKTFNSQLNSSIDEKIAKRKKQLKLEQKNFDSIKIV